MFFSWGSGFGVLAEYLRIDLLVFSGLAFPVEQISPVG
jgi:hypothetical protein